MIQFHKSNKNQWTNKFACGETVGKDLTKSPSQIPEGAIKVIRLGLSLCEAFSLPPRAIIKTEANRLLLAQMPFFVIQLRLRKLAFDATPYHKKSHNLRLRDLLHFCDSVGIRTQDPQLRRLLLYPAELPNQTFLNWSAKIEIIL